MTTTSPPLPPATAPAASGEKRPTPQGHRRDPFDLLFRALCQGAALLVILLFVLLVVVLVQEALPAMKAFGFRFLVTSAWGPEGSELGSLAFVAGTAYTSLIAMLLAVPLGLGSATFLSEIAPPLIRRVGAFLIELLAAIPSVVYGFWGLYFLAPYVGGQSVLCAGLILAIMVLPYITAISFDVCQAVPRSQREGSLALGSTRWQMIWTVILPYARPGILGGCILALGRALGETMAVVMLIGNLSEVPASPLDRGATVASRIALDLNTTSWALKRSALVELGLLLMVSTVVINGLAALLIHRLGKLRRGGSLKFRWFRRSPGAASSGTPRVPFDFTRFSKRAQWMNSLMTWLLGLSLVITCGPLFLILGYISYRGFSSLDLAFFTNTGYDDPPGLGHAIAGTGLLVLVASLWAVPIGILAAIFLAEYRKHPLVPWVRFVGELLAGVPSIIIGILGYALLVRPLEIGEYKLPALGFSGWAGAFALGVLMIPVVMRSAEESLKLVPQSLRQASYALGGAYWQTVLRVTLPAALAPVITGVLLAMGRIAGETAPLLLTASTRDYWPTSLNGPTPYLTYFIYVWSLEGTKEQQRLAWGGAFVLLAFVMLLNVGVRLLAGKRAVSATRTD